LFGEVSRGAVRLLSDVKKQGSKWRREDGLWSHRVVMVENTKKEKKNVPKKRRDVS